MEDNFTNREHLLAGELASAAGVSTDTLRHYERKGVLARPRRAANGYRLYPVAAQKRVLLVRRALSVGFTLDDLAIILSERERGGAPCRKVHKLLVEKLSNFEEQLVALTSLCDELRLTLSDWDNRLSRSSPGSQIGLLESLIPDGKSKPQSAGRGGAGKLYPDLRSKIQEKR